MSRVKNHRYAVIHKNIGWHISVYEAPQKMISMIALKVKGIDQLTTKDLSCDRKEIRELFDRNAMQLTDIQLDILGEEELNCAHNQIRNLAYPSPHQFIGRIKVTSMLYVALNKYCPVVEYYKSWSAFKQSTSWASQSLVGIIESN